jgi:hypothetical protein
MSDSLGRENFSGSDSTRAARQSFGKPNPITEPSFEKERNTIRPTRNFNRPRTNASLLRGSVAAKRADLLDGYHPSSSAVSRAAAAAVPRNRDMSAPDRGSATDRGHIGHVLSGVA